VADVRRDWSRCSQGSRIYLEGGGYLLDAPLPIVVDSDQTAAKFSKKSQTLKISAPEA